jgi:hypothetical protein
MQKLTFALSVACAALMACGCGNDQPPQPTAKDKDAAVKTQLLGMWERQSELGPVGYQRQFKAGGALVMREFRQPASTSAASTSASANPAGKAGPTMYHSQYKVDLPLDKEIKGTWTVEGGKLIRTVQLSNGDTIRILSRIDPLVATEFVEISDGVDGPVKVKYQRESARTRKKPT